MGKFRGGCPVKMRAEGREAFERVYGAEGGGVSGHGGGGEVGMAGPG